MRGLNTLAWLGLGLVVSVTGAQERVLFEQPTLAGVAGTFHVPVAEHKYPTDKAFHVLSWQASPYNASGGFVPTTWNAGEKTGFTPSGPLGTKQWGYRDKVGTTTVQIDGDVIGAYLNSADLKDGSDHGMDKMMITPAWQPAVEARVKPFAEAGMALVESLELQIPTAVDANKPGNFTYAVADMVFEDSTTKTKLTFEVALFHHSPVAAPAPGVERLRKTEVGQFDGPSQTFQVGNPLSPNSRLNTPLAGSTLWQSQSWVGWKPFRFAVTRENFAAGLAALKEKGAGFKGSLEPGDYSLTSVHLNAELKFGTGPAEMGWSMRGEKVALVPEGTLGK